MKNGLKDLSFYIILILVILFTFSMFQGTTQVTEMEYSKLVQALEQKEVEKIVLQETEAHIKLKNNMMQNI